MNYRYFLAVRKGAELLQCVYFATRTKLRQTAFVAILCNVKFRKFPRISCKRLRQIANRLTKIAIIVNRFITFVPQFGNYKLCLQSRNRCRQRLTATVSPKFYSGSPEVAEKSFA